MSSEEIKQKVLNALADTRYKWRTPQGVASQIGIPENEVLEVISTNADVIVQSTVPSTTGSPLFTTREHFHDTSSPLEKIMGAFKGRIR